MLSLFINDRSLKKVILNLIDNDINLSTILIYHCLSLFNLLNSIRLILITYFKVNEKWSKHGTTEEGKKEVVHNWRRSCSNDREINSLSKAWTLLINALPLCCLYILFSKLLHLLPLLYKKICILILGMVLHNLLCGFLDCPSVLFGCYDPALAQQSDVLLDVCFDLHWVVSQKIIMYL